MTDASPVLDLIDAFRRSKTMFAAVEMRIFDRVPGTISSLAAELNASEDALERLLDGCVGLGFLTRDGDHFDNTAVAATYLRWDSPDALVGYIRYSNAVLWRLWANLEDAVREGSHRWKQTFGLEGGIFSSFYRDDDAKEIFLRGMNALGQLSSPEIVRVFNLGRFRHLVDLGGGTGHLAISACERYGALTASVFDLPEAIVNAARYIEASRARNRIQLTGGDFFVDPLPTADLYAVGRILHDWGEQKIRLLLRKIFDALPPGGGLLIAERLVEEDRTGPVSAQMQSLNMLVCTEGKERTATEYRELLLDAGFASTESRITGAPLDATLALKAGEAETERMSLRERPGIR